MYQCPKGHNSTESDYCSECGAPIGARTLKNNMLSPAAAYNADICPDCGTSRTGGSRFCEVCRYDFQSKSSIGDAVPPSTPLEPPAPKVPASEAVPTEPSPVVTPPAPTSLAGPNKISSVIVAVDLSRLTEEDKQQYNCPTDTRDKIFPLDLDENLVGRRSEDKKIFPEIEIHDPGVSKRHLKFIKQEDGSFSALELNSANGTELNGAVLEPGILTPVNSGDQFTIGLWTKLKFK